MVGFLFYCFAVMLVLSSVAVIISLNPVYAVLSLILTFFISSALFILMGAEFIAMLVIIVYVGAVAVLFLFVIMMLDIGSVKMSHGLVKFYPIGIMLSMLFFGCSVYTIYRTKVAYFDNSVTQKSVENIYLIGDRIYTEYFYAFQMSGVLLLTAAVGTLVLTLNFGASRSLKQNTGVQVRRSSKIKLVSPGIGEGVEDV